MDVRRKDKANCGRTSKSSRKCDNAYNEFRDSPQGPSRGLGFIAHRWRQCRRQNAEAAGTGRQMKESSGLRRVCEPVSGDVGIDAESAADLVAHGHGQGQQCAADWKKRGGLRSFLVREVVQAKGGNVPTQ